MRYVIREKFFHLGEDSTIDNQQGVPVFKVDGQIFSLHNRLIMRDMAGNEVAQIVRRILSFTPTYEVVRGGQEQAEIRKHVFSPFIDRYTIDIPGPDDLEIAGTLFEHEYTFTRGGQVVATVSKEWLSMTATYGVDITAGQDDVLIIASVLALDLAEDHEK